MNLEMDNKFLSKLKLKNKNYLSGKYTLLSEVSSWEDICLVLDEFGCEHKVSFKNLMTCCDLKINSALNKKEYLIELLKSKGFYKNYTIIGDYISNSENIDVMTNYGLCKIRPNNLLFGKSPNIRSAVNKTEYFINMALEKHNYKYTYENVIWVTATDKVAITCKEHGVFWQTPNNHLDGKGCDKCRMSNRSIKSIGWSLDMWIKTAERSKNFESYKFYILRCWNEDEEFYKIGRTFNSIFQRYKNRFSYNYEIILEQELSAKECYEKEIKTRSKNKENKYKPIKKFNGYTECYKILYNYE